jgi:dihydrofolate reductase
MRRVIYGCAMSLDGYIAGPNGECDWIVMDPDIDFAAMAARFDTFLIGRKTFEAMRRMGSDAQPFPGIENIVFSRTLKPGEHPHVTVCADAERAVAQLRTKPGKDIALFGGGELFRSLLAARLVDGVEVSLIPVLLGGGIPLLPSPANRATLRLRGQRVYGKTGTVGLEYDINQS